MKCLYCDGNTWVKDTRPHKKGSIRRRECRKCLKRYTTYEVFVEVCDKLPKLRSANFPVDMIKLLDKNKHIFWVEGTVPYLKDAEGNPHYLLRSGA